MSPFTGIEVSFLVASVVASAALGLNGRLSPLHVLSYGSLAVIASYMHLLLVAFLGGWIREQREKKDAAGTHRQS
jgi:hypothetical protein